MASAIITCRSTMMTLRANYKHRCWNVLTSRSHRLTSAAAPEATSAASCHQQQADPAATSAASHQQQEKDGRSIWLKSLLITTGAFTFLIGTSEIASFLIQIVLLADQSSQLGKEPLQGNQISTLKGKLRSLEYRRLQCKGIYDEKNSIYVGPRNLKSDGAIESGYYLITPLIPLPGDPQSLQEPILVNRGWVPKSWRDKASLDASETGKQVVISSTTAASVQENTKPYRWRFWHTKKPMDNSPAKVPVEFTGVVRHSENKPNAPKNDPGSNKWSNIDIQGIALACGLSENTICVEDMSGNDLTSPFPYTQNLDEYLEAQLDFKGITQRLPAWYITSYVVFRKLRRPSSRMWDFQGARF